MWKKKIENSNGFPKKKKDLIQYKNKDINKDIYFSR